LDAAGKPVLGADGKPLVVTDPRVLPGGSIGAGGVILDAAGKPVLGVDGKPLIAGGGGRDDDDDGPDPRIPPGGWIGDGGIVLDKDGKPVLGADGEPQLVADPRVPKGGSIRKPGIIYDADGKPVLGPDGQPLMAGRTRGGGKPRKLFEYTPVGRMVCLRNMSATNIPKVEALSGKKAGSIPHPYLVCALLDETGDKIDEHKTGHFKSVCSCQWVGEVIRVFTRPGSTNQADAVRRSPPISVQISLMGWNRKSDHVLIAKWDVSLKRTKGKQTLDIPPSSESSSNSSERAFITFEYEVTPQMLLKQEEEQGSTQGKDPEDTDDDDGFGEDENDDTDEDPTRDGLA